MALYIYYIHHSPFIKIKTEMPTMAQNQTQQLRHYQSHSTNLSHQVAKTATAVTIGGTLTLLSGLTMVATVIGLILATPVLVFFSPVWIPAAIATLLLIGGFVISGGFAATAVTVFYWMYKYMSGQHPAGADELDRVRAKFAGAAGDLKDRAEHAMGTDRTTGYTDRTTGYRT